MPKKELTHADDIQAGEVGLAVGELPSDRFQFSDVRAAIEGDLQKPFVQQARTGRASAR